MTLTTLRLPTAVLLLLLVGTGCPRNLVPKKDAAFRDNPSGGAVVRGPKELPESVLLPPAPPGGAIQPPRSDRMAGTVPPLPGMPGSASRPQPEFDPLDDLTLASTDEERKGILQRIRERREKRNQPPVLPPALEPKQEKEPEKEQSSPKPAPTPMPPPSVPDQPTVKPPTLATPATGLSDARKVVAAAAKVFADTPDYTCHLTKRDAVGGKPQPQEEAEYAFRKEPFSVHFKVTGENGHGREALYVKGKNGGKMTIVTGKGDLIAGRKMEMDPDSPLVAARSRTRIYEAGLGRPIGVLTKFLDQADAGKRPADTIKYLGPVTRKDMPVPLVGIEVKLLPGDDPLFPKGGSRSYFFDADPKSQSHGLPVLITATEGGREAEYYAFTKFRRPANLTDADFSPDRMGGGKRR